VVVFAGDRVVLGLNEASVAGLVFTASFKMGLMLFLSHSRFYIMTVYSSCQTALTDSIAYWREAAFFRSELQTCCQVDDASVVGNSVAATEVATRVESSRL